MKRYLVRDTTMTAIADAVRNKTGTSDALGPIDMAEKIATIRVYEGDPTLIGVTITPTGTEIVKVPPNGVDGFGIVTVEGDNNLVPENIKEGVSIYGVDGTYREEVLDTSDATAEASDILEGATAYVNGKLIIGKFPSWVTSQEKKQLIQHYDSMKLPKELQIPSANTVLIKVNDKWIPSYDTEKDFSHMI